MTPEQQLQFYYDHLNERSQEIVNSIDRFLQSILGADQKQKNETAEKIILAVDALRSGLAVDHHPVWLNDLRNKMQWYISFSQNDLEQTRNVIKTVTLIQRDVKANKWQKAVEASGVGIDFDAIYRECLEASQLPALFDEMVSQLELIVKSKKIDSVTAQESLEKLIATIKQNATHDYSSTVATKDYINLFAENFGWECLESVPIIAPFAKAVRRTREQISAKVDQMKSQIDSKVQQKALSAIPPAEFRTKVPLRIEVKAETIQPPSE